MWKCTNGIVTSWLLLVVFLFSARMVSQQPAEPVLLPGTALRVALPTGWKLEPPRLRNQQHILATVNEPRYELWVSQTTPRSNGYSCMGLIGSMGALRDSGVSIKTRPPFVPDVYMGSVAAMTDVQLVCLSTGDSQVGVTIQAQANSAKPEVLSPMLAAIADAALKQSAAVSSPGKLKLPLLGIELALRDGTWGVRETTDVWGRNDVLGRAARPGSSEMNITPFRLPGRCESLGSTPPSGLGSAKFVPQRRYGGDRWLPGAWEQFPPPLGALAAYACRNVGTNSILLARIEHEKTAIPDTDVIVLRQMLDDMGNAVEARNTAAPGQPAVIGRGTTEPTVVGTSQVLSDTQGFNFAPYINVALNRVRMNWYAVMPEAARKGEKGRVGVIFTITRQGTVTDIRLAPASGNQILDNGAISAIQLSSPFAALPDGFKGDRLTLRTEFVYNQAGEQD